MNGFSVHVLLYGNYLKLAKRCLGSIIETRDNDLIGELRVGLNEVVPETRKLVIEGLKDLPFPVWIYECKKNALKYPLMRRMFYDPTRRITLPYIMWFDDDSCIVAGDKSWWTRVYMAIQQADMIGDLWRLQIQGNQAEGIKAQPWYQGVEIHPRGHMFRFATGGWWTIRTSLIQKCNYPWPELTHNGGDSTFGEVFRQQGLRLQAFKEGLWINADDSGKMSGASRRGVKKRVVWYDYDPRKKLDFSHHEFDVQVFRPEDA